MVSGFELTKVEKSFKPTTFGPSEADRFRASSQKVDTSTWFGHPYRVDSANFSRRKIGHAHDNFTDSENVAGARTE